MTIRRRSFLAMEENKPVEASSAPRAHGGNQKIWKKLIQGFLMNTQVIRIRMAKVMETRAQNRGSHGVAAAADDQNSKNADAKRDFPFLR